VEPANSRPSLNLREELHTTAESSQLRNYSWFSEVYAVAASDTDIGVTIRLGHREADLGARRKLRDNYRGATTAATAGTHVDITGAIVAVAVSAKRNRRVLSATTRAVVTSTAATAFRDAIVVAKVWNRPSCEILFLSGRDCTGQS
jgi:hypothetical protein